MATTAVKRKAPAANGQSSIDYLQRALNDLTKARDEAGDDIRAGIESAIDHTRDAMSEARSGARDQVSDWQKALEKSTDDIKRELGVLAVRAQSSPEALRAMSAEIRKRKAQLSE